SAQGPSVARTLGLLPNDQLKPCRVCRENQNSQKTGNEKSFVVIEKLVTRQIRARNFLTISPKVFFRQTLQGFALRETLAGFVANCELRPRVLAMLEPRAEISERLRRN